MSYRGREVRDLLERLEGRLSRAVLRGLRGSNAHSATRLYEELAYPMSELETYLQHLEKGQKPNINEKTAYIFAFFVTKKIDELKDVAKEIDEEYAQ